MKRKLWVSLAAASCLLCLLCLLWVLFWPKGEQVIEETRLAVEKAVSGGGRNEDCPVDFAALQAENEDIYAWLYIPGTGINEPLLQREGDSFYYLTHNSAGREDGSGALFTESAYNQKDFSDPAAVIYGKNSRQERLFAELQTAYSSAEGLKEYNEVIIYLPGEVLHYQVFAAVPFRNYHLLHYFNFGNENRYRAFLQAVDSVRAMDANRNQEIEVSPGDPLLILATTRYGSADTSYLVLAKRR